MTKRILVYGFPFFLMVLETVFRSTLRLDTKTFMGPSIAAVGVGFLLPLIVPKPRHFGLSKKVQREIEKNKISLISSTEQRLIDIIWIFIFILTSIWVYSLYLSSTQPNLLWVKMPAYLFLGLLNYFAGVLFTEIKEVV